MINEYSMLEHNAKIAGGVDTFLQNKYDSGFWDGFDLGFDNGFYDGARFAIERLKVINKQKLTKAIGITSVVTIGLVIGTIEAFKYFKKKKMRKIELKLN